MTITHRESLKDLAVSAEDSQPQKKGRKNPNWPLLLPRMQWAYERTVAMGLNGVEAAIFKHIVYVDGQGFGFFQHQKTIAQETGCKHSAISRALGKLVEKGLLEPTQRMGRTTKYCLIGLVTMPSEPISEGDDVISETDAVDLSKRQQNPEGNQELRTLISPLEPGESEELKNTSGTGDQDQDDHQDEWKPPELVPALFRNGMAYSKFQQAFHSGELTRDWAHELGELGGGVTLEETWVYETWFNDTHRITAATTEEYEKVIEENIRRFEEAHGLAPGEAA